MTQEITNQLRQLKLKVFSLVSLITYQKITLVLQIVQDLTTAVSQAILWTTHSPSIFSVFQEENKLYLAQSALY